MSISFALSALLMAGLPLTSYSARANDKLPDEASVKRYLASAEFTLNGWWRMADAPSRPSPGRLMELQWKTGPPGEFGIKLLSGRVLFGKGKLVEIEAKLTADADGEMEAATIRASDDGRSEMLKVQITPAGSWSLDFFGSQPTTTLTAKDFAEALTLCGKHSEVCGEALASLIAEGQKSAGAGPRPDDYPITAQDAGPDKGRAWRVTLPDGSTAVLERKEGRILRLENPDHTILTPATEEDAGKLRKQMAARDDAPLDIARVAFAHLTFHDTAPKLFVPAKGQSVKQVSKIVEVRTGTNDAEPDADEREDIAAYARPDAAAVKHDRFGEIIRLIESQPERVEPGELEDVLYATHAVHRTLERDFAAAPGTALACLEAGRGDIVALTRVVVEVCRQLGMATREVHGFIVHADCLPVLTQRHCWVEVLHEGTWTAFDPWMQRRQGEDEDEVVPIISGLHVRVCHGAPTAEREKFLNARPDVTVAVADNEPAERIEWPEGDLRRILQENRRNPTQLKSRER